MARRCTAGCFLALIAGVLAPLNYVAQAAQPPTHRLKCSVTQAEIALFKSYLGPESSESQTVVTSTYVSPELDVDSLNLRLAANGRGIPPDVREDFKKQNSKSCNIDPFGGVEKIGFITEAELDQLSKQSSNEFRKRFGTKSYLVTFSRVGFNKERSLALVHVSVAADRFGNGALYLFEKKQNKWVVKTKVATFTT